MVKIISINVKNYVVSGANALVACCVRFNLIVPDRFIPAEEIYIKEMMIEEIHMDNELLQRYEEKGMMNTTEAAELKNMIFSKKERCVLKIHKNKFCRHNDGRHSADYCYTSVKTENGRKKISGSYCDVISKLYNLYYGFYEDDVTLCFADIRADFETWYAIGRQPATLMVDCKVYGNHIKGSKLDKVPIRRMDYQDIKSFFVNFSKEHAGEYSKSLYNKIRSCIYNMLEYALDEGIISTRIEKYHFTKAVIVCFSQHDRRETWTTQEYSSLIEYLEIQDDVFSFMFEYQLLTGDRYETISALRCEDIDEEKCLVHIHAHNTLAPIGSERSYTVKEGTKGNSQNGRRYMPVTDFTMAVLKRAMDIDPESGFVFSFRGKPIQYNTYASHVHILCEEAGVTYHNPHSARAYIASKLNTGDNIAQMSDYFGWSDKKMALRYNRNIDRETAEIREKLELINPVHPSAPKNPLSKFHKEKAANT